MERHRKTGTPGNVVGKRVRRPCLSVFDAVFVSLLSVCVLYFGWSIGQRVSLTMGSLPWNAWILVGVSFCCDYHDRSVVCATQSVSQITKLPQLLSI